MAFQLTSPAFKEGGTIPSKYTCEGINVSIPLAWSGAPFGTKSFALIYDDPDCAGAPFVHWLLYNLPGHHAALAEAFPKEAALPDGTLQGTNDFGKVGYGGPCPPTGSHRYYFKLYALDQILPLHSKARRREVELAMKNHVLDHTQLMGTYRKQRP